MGRKDGREARHPAANRESGRESRAGSTPAPSADGPGRCSGEIAGRLATSLSNGGVSDSGCGSPGLCRVPGCYNEASNPRLPGPSSKLRRAASYGLSWLRADFLGHTVCKLIGHRPVPPSLLTFQHEMADAFGLPPDHDIRKPICSRCGGDLA